MDEEKCYVFKPSGSRPAKRRRVDTDADATRSIREKIFERLWSRQHQRIQSVLEEVNRATLDEMVSFLDDSQFETTVKSNGIRAGFVLAGPDTTSHSALFEQLGARLEEEDASRVLTVVRAHDATNLKTLLKKLIRSVTGEDEDGPREARERLLDYDLQAVHRFMKDAEKETLVIGIADSEAFPAHVLADFVDLLSSWSDRISTVLLFGIATSIDIFQDRLPRATLKGINTAQFDVVRSDELLERMFIATIIGDDGDVVLRLGPGLSNLLLQRHKQNIQTPDDFVNSLRYAYMCHFYANPLTVLLGDPESFNSIPEVYFQALKSSKSFQNEMHLTLNDLEETDEIRNTVQSDKRLFDFAQLIIQSSRKSLNVLTESVQLLEVAMKQFTGPSKTPLSSLYLQALEGELRGSSLLREFLLSIKKAPSNILSQVLSVITPYISAEAQKTLDPIRLQLKKLLQNVGSSNEALKSQYDLKNQTMRTTVVAYKVELSRHKANVSEADAAYSKVLDSFHEWIASYLDETLIPAHEVGLSEILIYDGRGPDKAVFMPRHRYVIERALSSPHDYLNCECCNSTSHDGTGETALSSTQPATALLYQLYVETGSTINVADLWSAFNGIMSETDEADEKQNMYLFHKALAELKYLGMVKATKKKADHVLKVSWKGL